MRIGHGYDVHRLMEGRPLMLGGMMIPHNKGLLGHSDADVLLHAICDALLGALALGDIGRHFPDSDNQFRGISSMMLLGQCVDMMRARAFRLGNLDATVIAQEPRLAEFIPEMIRRISDAFGCAPSRVNVKATTEEGLGFTGEKLAIAAHCVCLLEEHALPEATDTNI